MLSEGALRAQRICRELEKHSKDKGVSLEELEEVTYVMLGGMILLRETYIHSYLRKPKATRFGALITDLLENGNPHTTEPQLQELKQLLSLAMDCEWRGVERSAGVLALAIRHLAGMLMHELSETDWNVRLHVLDVLFYKLYARHVPVSQKHHQVVAAYARPLAQLFGGVAELQPGPGEVFTFSGLSEGRDINFNQHPEEIPHRLNERLRFLRNLRLAAHGLDFEGMGATERSHNLWVFDSSIELPRAAYGDTPVMFFRTDKIQQIVDFRRKGHPPVLAVLRGKDRRQGKTHTNLRRELVKHHMLRAVVDFTGYNTKKGTSDFSLLYFGPPFPEYPDRIAQIDARQLHPDLESDEAMTCAALVGILLRTLTQGLPLSRKLLEESGAPRRVIEFIEQGLPRAYPQVPGFVRFVTARQMEHENYSLRAADYVEQKEDQDWYPETDISLILSSLQSGKAGQSVYLIGDNGSGKSLALRDVAIALAYEKRQSLGIAFGTTDRFEKSPGAEPMKSNFIYAGARTFQSGPNMRRTLGELGDMANHVFDDPKRLGCLEHALDALGFKPRQFLVPIGMSSTSNSRQRALADIHPLSALDETERQRKEQETRRNLPKGAYKIAVIRNDSPEIVTFDALSSGEQQILTMVIKIAANVQPDTTVLLDEPEISLHVEWQRQLPQVLREFSRVLGCSFVVATHSPVLIASTNDVNDHCFLMRKRRLFELTPAQRRSVEASLFEGFQTYTPYTHHIQERCAQIISGIIGESDDQGRVSKKENAFLEELLSLKNHLGQIGVKGAANDRTLIDKAIAAVREILTP
ncbi:AAA family ATPase [Pseudomonas chlororaphis]|uniref:AAA family ATPase n=1 Tax=Pseudomonas chlororaphis TaxID=587753 RepID=UPI0035D42E88